MSVEVWRSHFGERLVVGQPLAPLTTYKVGGPAWAMIELTEADDLKRLVAARVDDPKPVLVLGRGSNMVVSDRGFPGVVVRLAGTFNKVDVENGLVVGGGAVSLPRLARAAVQAGRGGLEFLVAIPGSVGGAIRMNAGCHGSETADWLAHAELFDLDTGAARLATADDLGFSYRTSNVAEHEIVVSGSFRSEPVAPTEGEATMRNLTRWRREHQPGGTLNAGSVFKNPEGDYAGRIIEDAGLKGFRVGRVSVSEKHANFFVAEQGATAQEIYDLVTRVRQEVLLVAGVSLETEIRFIGAFE